MSAIRRYHDLRGSISFRREGLTSECFRERSPRSVPSMATEPSRVGSQVRTGLYRHDLVEEIQVDGWCAPTSQSATFRRRVVGLDRERHSGDCTSMLIESPLRNLENTNGTLDGP